MKHVLFIALILMCGCAKNELDTSGLTRKIYLIGHGGCGFEGRIPYPANSWSSITKAVEHYGLEGVEVDIQLTHDSVLFIYHDRTLDAGSYCSGCLYDYDSAALARCSYRPVSFEHAGIAENIVPFDRILDRFSKRSIKPLVFADLHIAEGCSWKGEIGSGYSRQHLNRLYDLLAKFDAFDWVYVQTGNASLIDIAADYTPMKILYDGDQDSSTITWAASRDLHGIAAKRQDLSVEETAFARSLGLYIQLYDAASESDMKDAIGKAPDYLLTDNIFLSQSLLR